VAFSFFISRTNIALANEPARDSLFEVWNAALEMGGATGANLKSAFQSQPFLRQSGIRRIESGA